MKRSVYILMMLLTAISFHPPGICLGQPSKVIGLAAGQEHSVALKDNGTVWAWGDNAQGTLGDGTTEQRLTPVQVIDPNDPTGYLNGIIAISSGTAYGLNVKGHTLALKQSGTVWGWGNGYEGQLGDGQQILRSAPIQVKHTSDPTGYLTDVIGIGAGDVHSVGVKKDGTVWAWGNNDNGQLGDGTKTRRLTAVQVTGLSGGVAVAAGENHSVALKQDGTVWGWGNNTYGQLGDGTWTLRTAPSQVVDPADPTGKLTGVIAVSAGGSFTLALKNDGTMRGWGFNLDGRLGDGTSGLMNWKNTPVKVIDPGDPTGFLTGVKAIAAADSHSMALKQDGTVRTWGYNGRGQLGDGTLVNQSKPVQVPGLSQVVTLEGGYGHSLAAKADGTVWAWGGNWAGQLGDGTTLQRLTPVMVTFPLQPERTLLSVRGPYFITPGEEVTYLIQYDNIQSQTLNDSIVIFDLPAGFEYVSSTNGGIYRDDRHQVFWKLGNLNPNALGYVSVKVMVPWGLSAHQKIGMSADLAARNITSSTKVDDYLNYVPVAVVTEKELTQAEIDTLLNSDKKLKSLFDYALSLGYVFSKAAWQVVFDNGSSPWVFVLFDPEEFGPVSIKKVGDTVFMEKYQGTLYSLSNGMGGLSLDSNDNQFKTWGTWAQVHIQTSGSQDEPSQPKQTAGLCILNCIANTVPGWVLWVRSEFNGTNPDCQECQKAVSGSKGDSTKCPDCARRYVTVHQKKHRYRYGDAVAACVEGCDREKDPEKWECAQTDERKKCEPVKTSAGDYTIGVAEYFCKVTSSGSRWERASSTPCYPPEVCRQLEEDNVECVVPCRTSAFSSDLETRSSLSSSIAVESLVREAISEGDSKTKGSHASRYANPEQGLVSSASSTLLCEPSLIDWLIELIFAHDPNAKAVDFKGNVIPGQKLTYTIEYENLGEGTAYGVFILDELDPNLDDRALVINNGGSYSAASRVLSWDIGTLPSKGKGSVTFSVNVKAGLPSGTQITNFADVYFPSVPEITPTNPVVNMVKAIAADPKTMETTSEKATPITLSGRDTGSNQLTYKITQPPGYGTLSGIPPNVTYTSMEDFSGMDEFYYVVNNGLIDSDPARVLLKINPSPADTNPPAVVSTYPKVSATDVHVDPNPISANPAIYRPSLWATFSEPIDATTVTTSTFTVNGGITGTVAYDEQTWTASFIPTKAFAASTTYTVKLGKGIKDKAGNEMAGEYSWQFTTESPANIVVNLPDNGTELNYGEVLVNQVSSEKVASVQNTGTLDLVLGTITRTGTNAGDFKITDDRCSGKTLSQSDNCTVRVAFQPLSLGTKSASLSIPSNDPDTPTANVVLKGKSVGLPDIKVDPREVNYGKVLKGGSLDRTITVRNDGDGSLVLSGIGTPAAPFSLAAGGTCAPSKTLSPGGSCSIVVRFSPTTQGSASSGFDITSNDADEGKVSVQLSGQGALFVVSPTEGTIGTVLAITGTGFGGKKGKVGVGGTALKLTDWSNTTIHGSLGKALSPDVGYDVMVTPGEPRGAKPIMETEAFTVRRPDITAGTYHGSPNATVTVTGKYFGTTKGKVYLGTTSCKVVSWTMNTSTGESTVGFVVPTKIAKGSYDLKITNAVGSGTAKFTVD